MRGISQHLSLPPLPLRERIDLLGSLLLRKSWRGGAGGLVHHAHRPLSNFD